jgi:chromosome condensin MukBEF ATPase and DNA-binding subunit MukB
MNQAAKQIKTIQTLKAESGEAFSKYKQATESLQECLLNLQERPTSEQLDELSKRQAAVTSALARYDDAKMRCIVALYAEPNLDD